MLTKNQIKLITQLKTKKYRDKMQLFVVEGLKSIREFIADNTFDLYELYTIDDTLFTVESVVITEVTLKKISFLKNPNKCLAVFKIPEKTINKTIPEGLKLVLDNISDPGNLGTIIRLCDWFGIETLYCSKETVDCYNPKVVQATMGSLNRVQVVYTDILALLDTNSDPVYGAFMDGESIYKTTLKKETAFLVIGNEANGISSRVKMLITAKISIPKFGKKQETESLNAAIATGILLSEFRR